MDYAYSQEESSSAHEGQRVRHAVFGEGTIMLASGSGENAKLKIRFDRVGIKTVMVRFANLEPL